MAQGVGDAGDWHIEPSATSIRRHHPLKNAENLGSLTLRQAADPVVQNVQVGSLPLPCLHPLAQNAHVVTP